MSDPSAFTPDLSLLGALCACRRAAKGYERYLGKVSHLLYAQGREPRYVCGSCAEEAPLGTLVRALRAPNTPSPARVAAARFQHARRPRV